MAEKNGTEAIFALKVVKFETVSQSLHFHFDE